MIIDKAQAEHAAATRKRFDPGAIFRHRLVYDRMDAVLDTWCRRREIRTEPFNVFRYGGAERGPRNTKPPSARRSPLSNARSTASPPRCPKSSTPGGRWSKPGRKPSPRDSACNTRCPSAPRARWCTTAAAPTWIAPSTRWPCTPRPAATRPGAGATTAGCWCSTAPTRPDPCSASPVGSLARGAGPGVGVGPRLDNLALSPRAQA